MEIRNRCGKKKHQVNIGYINMQGSRKKEKWEEIEDQLSRESFSLCGVMDTYLRNT